MCVPCASAWQFKMRLVIVSRHFNKIRRHLSYHDKMKYIHRVTLFIVLDWAWQCSLRGDHFHDLNDPFAMTTCTLMSRVY